ncbi:putative quinol monooxygenase [Thalassospira alkalitolerans]|uniref:putative quinol monooxygenase n=1 Tax=Thalassospira alkalitolerans TaxID=1293890 RepID=UPI003AA922CD
MFWALFLPLQVFACLQAGVKFMSAYVDPSAANLNNGFVVSVRIVAKEGEAEAVADILEGLVGPSMAEPGMKFFMPYRSAINPAEFFVYELYENKAGWDAHNASSHFLNVVDELIAKAASRERIPFVPFVK